jgi:hypothetical protein
MKLLNLWVFVTVVALCCFKEGALAPVGNPESVGNSLDQNFFAIYFVFQALEIMLQIPQWHCMRYRKFELVRRCRGYKNSLRRL